MINCNPRERESIEAAGQMGGEYLESIGKSDLETLSRAEWLIFVEAIVTGFQDHLAKLLDRGDLEPF